MYRSSYVLSNVLLALILLLATAYVVAAQTPQEVTITQVAPTEVLQAFSSGQIDVYLNPFFITPDVLSQLAQNPNITLVSPAPTTAYDLLLNPYPSNTTFNPLAYWQVRFLLNYLVDRDRIISEVFAGSAQPMVAYPSIFAVNNFLPIIPYIASYNVHYDLNYVNSSLYSFLSQVNRTDPTWRGRIHYINHRWYYTSPSSNTLEPVTLIFFVRTDDPYRNKIGLIFASALNATGFTVKITPGTLALARQVVYGSNPADMKWSIYTESWTITPQPWDLTGGASFCASWVGNMPGWGEASFWQYKNSTIDDLTLRLANSNFTSINQFLNYSNTALEYCFQQAVRLWIVSRTVIYPISTSIRNYIPSILGLENPVGLKFAYSTAHPNVLNVGMRFVTQFPWNPLGWLVSVDAYSVDTFYFIEDPFANFDPLSTEPMPFRGNWRVIMDINSAAPKYPVPPDAVVWDAVNQRWVPVGPGKMAKAIVYLYFNGTWLGTKWQNDQPITMADVIFYFYLLFDLANPNATDLGPNVAQLSDLQGLLQPTASLIAGLEFFDNGTVVVYSNYWFPDPNFVASTFAPGYLNMMVPWEVYAAMLAAFSQGKGAFTASEAEALKVPTIDLTVRDSAAVLKDILADWASRGYVWDNGSVFRIGGKSFLTPSDAVSHYEAAIRFFNTYNHLFIGNGPYILTTLVTTAPQSSRLVRWSGYPFDYNYWVNKLYTSRGASIPPRGMIVPTVTSVTPGQIEANTTAVLTINVNAIGNPIAYLFIISPSGGLIYSTNASSTTPGSLSITLPQSVTSRMAPGTYTLLIYVLTDKVKIPTQYSTSLAVTPYVPPPSGGAPTPPSAPGGLSLPIIVAIVIIIVIVVALAAWLLRRR